MRPEIRLTPPRRARRRMAGLVIPWMLSRRIFRWRLAPPCPRPFLPFPRPDILLLGTNSRNLLKTKATRCLKCACSLIYKHRKRAEKHFYYVIGSFSQLLLTNQIHAGNFRFSRLRSTLPPGSSRFPIWRRQESVALQLCAPLQFGPLTCQ